MLSLAVSLLGAPTSAARNGGGGGRGGGSVVSMFLFAGHMIITTCKHTPYTDGWMQIHFSLDSFSFIGCLSYYPKDNPFFSVKFYRYGILDDLLRRFSCLSSFRSSRSAIF